MSKTIWIVESGSYSDYRVDGIFTSKANADEFAALLNKPDSDGNAPSDTATVEERELDPCLKEVRAGLGQFTVLMDRNGNVERCERQESFYKYGSYVTVWRRAQAPVYQHRPEIIDAVTGTVWAKDEKHAIKIVNEKRAQFIASGEMP